MTNPRSNGSGGNGTSSNDTRSNDTRSDENLDVTVDLQIVGGGLAGLLTAARAADRGLRVRLFEKSNAGGRAKTNVRDGFKLNNGPHALYLDGGLDRALTELGIGSAGSAPALKGASGTIGDRQDLLPQGLGSMWRTSLISGSEKRRLAGMMARLPRMETSGLGGVSVDEWLADMVGGGDLAHLCRGLITLATYNRASDLASADAAVDNLKMAIGKGVRYLAGGWQQLVDQLEQHCVRTGRVEIVKATVTRVVPGPGGDGWICETGSGSGIGATVVIAGLAPAVVDGLLGTDYVTQAGPPVRASVLDLGLVERPRLSTLIGLDSGLYYSLHSVADDLAPAGRALVSLARYQRPDDDMTAEQSRAILDAHRVRAGVADDDIIMERYLHRSTVTWGMPLASQGGLSGRPGVTVEGMKGCFIAGDWVGPSGLLADAAAHSAGVAVDEVVAHVSSPRPAVATSR